MKTTLLLLAFLSSLLAEIPSSDISSDSTSFNGDVLVLEGHVRVDHDLGTLKAEHATLNKGETSLEFSTIELEDQVSIFFESHGTLSSEKAFFDLQTLSGTISSKDYPVIYKSLDYDLFCKTMDLSLTQDGNRYAIEKLTAKQDVHIESRSGFTIECEKASYQENELIASGETPCLLTHGEDKVDAKNVHFDLETSLLTFEDPKGSITSLFFPDNPERNCLFSARLLIWDHHQDLLTLKQNISIQDPAFGMLIGENLFSLKQRRLFGKRTLQSIETEGKTILISNENERLTNYGTVKLDRDELLLTCDNPPDKRLKYETEALLLYADSARIEYAFQGLEIKPHAIYLDGNVQILSHDLSRPLRKGLADHIFHNPIAQETHLLADEGNHVLFWDEEKKLSLSAPEILIEHGDEDLVKGLGTVRFTFTEEEGKKIDELFHKGDK